MPNIKALGHMVSDEIFSGFPYISLYKACKTCDPGVPSDIRVTR